MIECCLQRRHLLEGGDRVLVVANVERLDLAQHPARRRQRPLHVGIEPDHGILAQRLAQHAHRADLEPRVTQDQLALEEGRAVRLAHREAIVDDRLRAHLATRPVLLRPEGKILGERDVLAHRSAEQLVERHGEGPGLDVPQGELDRAEGDRGGILAGVGRDLPRRHAARFAIGEVERVGADQRRGDLLPDHLAEMPPRRLAQAHQALVRLHLDDRLGRPAIEPRRPPERRVERHVHVSDFDIRDLHRLNAMRPEAPPCAWRQTP
jgi:hypothetical protein